LFKIKTYNKEKSALLKPGFRAIWNQKKRNLNFKKVNTELYTSWKDGRIIFEHVKFKNIIKKLERKYDVSIENTNFKLDHQIFTASFDIETIEQVLNSFGKNFPINYEIRNRNITIY
jgi:ferric-dicitrate binding protein FerR (iron transport regulator)